MLAAGAGDAEGSEGVVMPYFRGWGGNGRPQVGSRTPVPPGSSAQGTGLPQCGETRAHRLLHPGPASPRLVLGPSPAPRQHAARPGLRSGWRGSLGTAVALPPPAPSRSRTRGAAQAEGYRLPQPGPRRPPWGGGGDVTRSQWESSALGWGLRGCQAAALGAPAVCSPPPSPPDWKLGWV